MHHRFARNPWLAALVLGVVGTAAASARQSEFLVADFSGNAVERFDAATGAHLGTLDTMTGPQAIVYGPDGLLYIAAELDNEVLRYDPVSLTRIDVFVADDPITPADETGGLSGPTGLAFGADGHLYVASFDSDAILSYDGSTGAFRSVFVTPQRGGLNGPDAGIAFGPDGHLYVPSFWNHRVLRYDGATGAFLGTFIPAGLGGLNQPRVVRFRSDGLVYVSSFGSNRILRFDAAGNFIDDFITQNTVTGFVLSPVDGDVYATSSARNLVRRFDGGTGARVSTPVRSGSGGLQASVFLAFVPDPDLHLSRLTPGLAGVVNTLNVRRASPNSPLFVVAGTQAGSLALGGCPNRPLGIGDPTLLVLFSDAQGSLSASGLLDASLQGLTLRLQVVDLATCRVSPLLIHTFP